MSHIVEFTIEGLAGRNDIITQKLNRDINVFFGKNGSGKTSLLKIFHSAMTNDGAVLNRVPFKKAEIKIYSIDYDKIYTRTINKPDQKTKPATAKMTSEVGSEREEVFRIQRLDEPSLKWDTKPAKEKGSSIIWAHRYLPTSRLYLSKSDSTLFSMRGEREQPWLTDEYIDEVFARSLEACYYEYKNSILRKIHDAQEKGLASILRAFLSSKPRKRKRKREEITIDETSENRVFKFIY